VIIDEISFAHAGDFEKIQRHLHLLMGGGFNKPYGGLNVIFAGDYSQLEPVGKTPIYLVDEFPEFHGMVNTFIELDGKWRFMDDPVWGERLLRFRQGVPTSEDIKTINDSCSLSNRPKPPKGIQVATHRNRDRDAINSSIFEEFCKKSAPKDGSVLDSAVCFSCSRKKQCREETLLRALQRG
jgi:PIF1-like helicase